VSQGAKIFLKLKRGSRRVVKKKRKSCGLSIGEIQKCRQRIKKGTGLAASIMFDLNGGGKRERKGFTYEDSFCKIGSRGGRSSKKTPPTIKGWGQTNGDTIPASRM